MVLFEMLVARGGRLNAKNHGGDTALHLAAAHGHRDVVSKVSKSSVNLFYSKLWCVVAIQTCSS